MPAKTFRLWTAYSSIEPFGAERDDLRMGIETSWIVNALQSKGGRRLKPADIMPRFDRPSRQTAAEMNAVMMQFAAHFEAFEANNVHH